MEDIILADRKLADRKASVLLPDRSLLECEVLSSSTAEKDIFEFADFHKRSWPNLPPVSPEILSENIEKGIIFGAYIDNKPATLLRMAAFYIPDAEAIAAEQNLSAREKAYEILRFCPQTYNEATNMGKWNPVPENANVVGLIDITSHPDFRGKPIAKGMIEYVKITHLLGMNGFRVPPNLERVKLAFTLTPKPDDYDGDFEGYYKAIIKFHRDNGAFNTGYIFRNARPGQDALATAYIAPGYLPLPLKEFSVTGKSL